MKTNHSVSRRRIARRLAALLLTPALLFTAIPLHAAAAGQAKSSKELAVEIAAEGTVLLENNGALPLPAAAKLAVFGTNQSGTFYAGGGGSGGSNTTDILTTAQALKAAEKQGKLSLYEPLLTFYNGLTQEKLPDAALLEGASDFTDTALVCIGRWSEEGVDRTLAHYYLSSAEKSLLSAVCDRFDTVIVAMNICAVTDLAWVDDYSIDALLVTWMPGQYGAAALPLLLTGEITPSGKLVDTFADSYDAYPTAKYFGGTHVDYEEDIFLGYRYFETFDDAYDHVLYPFGYGMSYTTFDLTDITVTPNKGADTVTINVKVTNTGAVAGKEVVQVYFGHPENNVLGYAAKELAAYQKTDLLAPGQSQTLTMTYTLSDMAGYDDTGKIQKSAYVLEKGDYPVYVGTSVRDVVTAASITVDQTTVTEQLTECGVSVMQLECRLLADGSYEELEQRPPVEDEGSANVTVISAVGTSILEAESYYRLEGNDSISISNGALHATHLGGTLYYTIDVELYDEYTVYINTAQGANVGKDCLKVYVDGELQSSFRVDIDETSGGWEIYRYYPCGTLELDEGRHTLMIKINNGAIGNMESFRICSSTEEDGETFDLDSVKTDKPIYATGSSSFSSLDYDATTNKSLATNNGYLEGLHHGGTLTYILYAEQAADYLISIGTACGNDGSDSAMSIQINGIPQLHFNLSTKGGTGGWSSFKDISCGYISLNAGKNEFVIIPSSGVNLADITLERLPGAPTGVYDDRPQIDEKDIIPLSAVYADRTKMDAFLEQLTNTELMSLVQGKMPASNWGDLERYGIPKGTVSDGPAGLRAGTYWPVAVTQACTWNVPLIEQMGLHIGSEGYDLGVDIWLAPALNIHRNPLNGRNFEYYSEDPLISGTMAAAAVSGCQAQGVLVTLKHLAANNCEAHRTSSDSRMSERALREIYLEGFRVALKLSDAWGVMTSYNRINSIEPAESYDILTTIVRGEWGYDGLIMSDWWNDSSEVGELIAGNNLKMPEGNQGELIAALNNGWLTRDHLKTSAKYILEAMFRVDRLKSIFDPSFKHVEATKPLRPAEEQAPAGDKDEDNQPLTPPDDSQQQPPTTDDGKKSNQGLLIGLGAAAAAIAAAAVAAVLLLKKKKK